MKKSILLLHLLAATALQAQFYNSTEVRSETGQHFENVGGHEGLGLTITTKIKNALPASPNLLNGDQAFLAGFPDNKVNGFVEWTFHFTPDSHLAVTGVEVTSAGVSGGGAAVYEPWEDFSVRTAPGITLNGESTAPGATWKNNGTEHVEMDGSYSYQEADFRITSSGASLSNPIEWLKVRYDLHKDRIDNAKDYHAFDLILTVQPVSGGEAFTVRLPKAIADPAEIIRLKEAALQAKEAPKRLEDFHGAPTAESLKRIDRWFTGDRYGIFIHWGIYSLFAGDYNGKDWGLEKNKGGSGHIMRVAGVPVDEYRKKAEEFNPVHFDAKEWARLFKASGARYVVLVSKHHDGFSLWDTAATDWDVFDATPFDRDIVKELGEACRAEGLRFGIYYSHRSDWVHRAYPTDQTDDDGEVPMEPHYRKLVHTQLDELLTNYGEMCMVWFDVGGGRDADYEANISFGEQVRRLQPDALITSRLVPRGRWNLIDVWSSGDRYIADKRYPHNNGESCMTMRLNWVYDRDEDRWFPKEELVERLALNVGRGANMLLNVAPTGDGRIVQEERDRLAYIAEWLKANGESIYGAGINPFPYEWKWGTLTAGENAFYLHVFERPESGSVAIDGILTPVGQASILATGAAAPFTQSDSEVVVTLPEDFQTPGVVKLAFDKKPEVQPAEGGHVWKRGDGRPEYDADGNAIPGT